MIQIRLRRAARNDLRSIWHYSAERWGIAQADQYVANIDQKIRTIVDFPQRFAPHASQRRDFRKAPSGEHLIFFLVEADQIDVVRVLHKSMDFEGKLG